MNRPHAELRALLDDHLDGALAGAERQELERHLRSCEECRSEADSLLELRAAARALPREIPPSRDLWPEIRARLQDTAPPAAPPRKVVPLGPRMPRRIPAWWGLAAAASVALVALTAGIGAQLLRQAGPAPDAAVAARPAQPAQGPMGLAAFQEGHEEYIGAVEGLHLELDARREQLSPETLATVEHNLSIIDGAIAETRRALASDPGNRDLPHLLSTVYRKKVELLQDAVRLPAQS